MSERDVKEIMGSLQLDVKDLVKESAGLVTGFFSKGLCSIRAVKNKWKTFAQEVGAAVGKLQQPAAVKDFDRTPPALLANGSPVVTVLESADENLPAGKRMTLLEANQLVQQLDEQYVNEQRTQPVKLQIDFMVDGEPDRYQITQELGSGDGSIISHMRENAARYLGDTEKLDSLFDRVPEPFKDTLQERFAGFLNQSISHVTEKLIPYFEMHVLLAAMEAHKSPEIAEAPGAAAYGEEMRKYISDMRVKLNLSALGEIEPERPPRKETAREEPAKPSVRMQISKCKHARNKGKPDFGKEHMRNLPPQEKER